MRPLLRTSSDTYWDSVSLSDIFKALGVLVNGNVYILTAHDGGDGASSCSSSGFLMSPVSVSNADQTDAEWSSCSGSIFESRYAQAADTNGYHPYSCLSNNPLPPSAVGAYHFDMS